MPIGAGAYNDEVTRIRELYNAEAVLLIVVNGSRGHGVSIQCRDGAVARKFPAMLKDLADGMEQQQVADLN